MVLYSKGKSEHIIQMYVPTAHSTPDPVLTEVTWDGIPLLPSHS